MRKMSVYEKQGRNNQNSKRFFQNTEMYKKNWQTNYNNVEMEFRKCDHFLKQV